MHARLLTRTVQVDCKCEGIGVRCNFSCEGIVRVVCYWMSMRMYCARGSLMRRHSNTVHMCSNLPASSHVVATKHVELANVCSNLPARSHAVSDEHQQFKQQISCEIA